MGKKQRAYNKKVHGRSSIFVTPVPPPTKKQQSGRRDRRYRPPTPPPSTTNGQVRRDRKVTNTRGRTKQQLQQRVTDRDRSSNNPRVKRKEALQVRKFP